MKILTIIDNFLNKYPVISIAIIGLIIGAIAAIISWLLGFPLTGGGLTPM